MKNPALIPAMPTILALACVTLFALGGFFFAAVLPAYFLPLSAGLLVIGALACLTQNIKLPRHSVPLLILFAIGWGWAGLQTLQLPDAFLGMGMPPLWLTAQNALGFTHPTLSLTPDIGQRFWLFGMAAAILFLLGGHLAGQGKAGLIHRCTASVITVFSAYGLFVYATGNNSVLWLPKTSYVDSLTATFINKNTYATAAGIAVFLCLYLAFKYLPNIPSARSATPRQRLHIMYHTCIKKGWPWLVMALVNWMALVLTQSRAGMASTLLALIVWWLVVAFKTRGGRVFWMAFGSLALILLFAILSLTGQNLGARLQATSTDAEYRQSLNETTISIWQSNPIAGAGLGSYNSNYRMFSPLAPNVSIRMEQAHNTWLQTLAELGLPAALSLFAAIGWLAYRLALTVKRSRSRHMAPATGLAIMVLAGAHAWPDFSANIPAILLLLALTLGTIWGQKDKPQVEGQASERLIIKTGYRLAAASILLLLSALTAWQIPAAMAENKAQHILTKSPTVEELKALRPVLATTLKTHPNATLFAQLGRTDFLLSVAGNNQLLQFSALNFTNQSLARAPADPYLWHQRAMLMQATGNQRAAADSTILSIITGPAEGLLAYPRLTLIQQLWPVFSTSDKNFLIPHIRSLYAAHKWKARNIITAADPVGGKEWLVGIVREDWITYPAN